MRLLIRVCVQVTYKMGLGTGTVNDDQILEGDIRVGQVVQIKHPEKKELCEATITKIQDCSQYTVGMFSLSNLYMFVLSIKEL